MTLFDVATRLEQVKKLKESGMDRSLDEVDVRLSSDDVDHLSREEHYSSGRRSHEERGRSRSPRGRPLGGDIETGARGSGTKRVYVSNLHYDVKSKDLKTVFRRGEMLGCIFL